MDTECGGEVASVAAERDERISRSGSDSLTRSIDRDRHGQEAPGVAGSKKGEFGCGRQAVPKRRHGLMAAPPIREEAAPEASDGRKALVEAVNRSEGEGTQMQIEDEIDRQDAADHLGRYIREEACDAEIPDDSTDAGG